jgi:hypothetical protein
VRYGGLFCRLSCWIGVEDRGVERLWLRDHDRLDHQAAEIRRPVLQPVRCRGVANSTQQLSLFAIG